MTRGARTGVAALAIAALVATCAVPVETVTPGPSSSGSSPTAPPPSPVSSPSPTPRSGAQLQVRLEGTSGCQSSFVCTARLSVLPDGTRLDPPGSVQQTASEAVWQSDSGPGVNLVAPPDGDLPLLAPGAHLVVWTVMTQMIATDGPGPPAFPASQCSARVVVADGASAALVRIRFKGDSTLGSGSSACTARQIVDPAVTPAFTPQPIAGTALVPTASLPAAWRRITDPSLNALPDSGSRLLLAVAPDGAFVAIPSGSQRAALPVWRSTDGETWTKAGELPDSKDGWVHAVAWSSDAIVVTGGSSDLKGPGVWTSADGVTWTAVDASRLDGLHVPDALAANSGGFVAKQLGASGVAPWISSAQGTDWRRVGSLTATLSADIIAITAVGSGFVAVGAENRAAAAWHSPDGRSWQPATVAGGGGVTLLSVAANGQRLVAFGQSPDPVSGAIAFISDDGGHTWSRAPLGTRPDSSWPPVVAVAGGFIATGYGVWTSRDGVTWDNSVWNRTSGAPPYSYVPTIVASGNRLIAAAMPQGGGLPMFWVGEGSAP